MFMHGVLVIFVICCLHISQAVMGSGSGLPTGKIAKDEVPLIACQTCDHFSRALYYNLRIIQIEANESEKKKRISETKVEEIHV